MGVGLKYAVLLSKQACKDTGLTTLQVKVSKVCVWGGGGTHAVLVLMRWIKKKTPTG